MTANPERLERRARNILLHQLSRSMRTEQQLRELMLRREIPAEIFEPILVRFREAELIDDQKFADSYVATRLQAGKSVNAIRRELAGKGISQGIVDQATSEISAEQELARATKLALQRAARMASLEPQVARRRLQGFLARRGFSANVVFAALREVDRAR